MEKWGGCYSRELGIDLESGRSGEIFKWFLASILFGARIGDLQLKIPFESFIQFLNPANDPIHRSILSLLYFPMKPFQNLLILHSISPNNRSIALLGPKDTIVYLLTFIPEDRDL